MNQVVFSNGHIYSDDSDPNTGLANDGHRTRLVPMLSDTVTEVALAVSASTTAQAYADIAVNAPAIHTTSTTNNSLANSGTKTFGVTAGLPFAEGHRVRVSRTSDITKWMEGTVSANTGGNLSILMDDYSGAGGPYTDWTIVMVATTAGAVPSSRTISTTGLATIDGGSSANLTANRTIDVPKASYTEISDGVDDTKAITSKGLMDSLSNFQTLSDGATIEQFDASQYTTFYLQIAGTGRTFPLPTGMKLFATYYGIIADDGSGSRSITTWGAGIDGLDSLITEAGKYYIITLMCISAISQQCAGQIAGPF